LAGQGQGLRVLLVDDNSTDGTAEVARTVPTLDVQVIQGKPLVDGWTGKLWALEQGVSQVQTPLALMLDADIALDHGVISALKAQMRRGQYHFVSVMASLHMQSFWEKLLNPSFIYFFKMLYPFRLAKTKNPHFYSAAGGCIMVDKQVFPAIGGLASIRGELIDDCALARQVKRARFRTWIGQSRAVTSLRSYEDLGEIWNMVARSAYTQLHYSPWVLLATSFFLVTLFIVPVLGWLSPASWTWRLSLLALAMMMASYLPTLHFYRLSPLWAGLMPLVGILYLGMTWSSALRYWRGERSQWKGRVYR
jgi:hopene-associated glycosyltransferase HpnB